MERIITYLSYSTGFVSGFNDWVAFFQWLRPANSEESRQWHEELWKLETTLPLMQLMIDRAEWSLHKEGVASLLQELKGVSYDTEDLIEEFKYLKLKSETEDDARSLGFSNSDIVCSLNKIKILQERADYLISQMNTMVPENATPRFDRSVRPETSSFLESKIFGRREEVKVVKGLLGVPVSVLGSKRNRAALSTEPCLDEARIQSVSVVAIVGIGGLGKTTLAQYICHDQAVRTYFDQVFWICVSDEFDIKRLTTELLHCSGNGMNGTLSDNLNTLQIKLAKVVKSKRFLLVLDDIWEDSLKNNGQDWHRFCAPLMNALPESKILVTTRSLQVANVLCTKDPFHLNGLEDAAFWEFFKTCALDSNGCTNDSNLVSIGRKIMPKLKGSPLAAKTIGRLLRMKLDSDHWNGVLKSELWELKQETGDILPALRLSYVYLPQRLKRCLSLCAMFPKDHKFQQKVLVDIWLAQGFVASQGAISLSTVGDWYFEDLRDRGFFQKVTVPDGVVAAKIDKFVMHDLIHDMVQLVAEDECYVIRNETDLQHVPENVRHLSLFTNKSFDCKKLMALSRCKKVRSILSTEQLGKRALFPLLDHLANQLKFLRFLSCCFTTLNELPESVGNFHLLQCLKIQIPRNCIFKIFPTSFCSLYNLQTFEARNCHFEKYPREFGHLINLQFFQAKTFCYQRQRTVLFLQHRGSYTDISVLKYFNLQGNLHLSLSGVTVADATQIELNTRKNIHGLILNFHLSRGGRDQELLQVLCPHQDTEYLEIEHFKGDNMPTWFDPSYLQRLRQLQLGYLHVLTIAWASNGTDQAGFSSLTDLHIYLCPRVLSVDQILQPGSLPAIKSIVIEDCEALSSVPAETFGDFNCLEQLELRRCQNLQWIGLVLPPSLLSLCLEDCGDLSNYIPNSFLNLNELNDLSLLSLRSVSSIPAQLWARTFPKLKLLRITNCPDLILIGGSKEIAHIENVLVQSCPEVEGLTQPLRRGQHLS